MGLELLLAMAGVLAQVAPPRLPRVVVVFTGIIEFKISGDSVRAIVPNFQEGAAGIPPHRAYVQFPMSLQPSTKRRYLTRTVHNVSVGWFYLRAEQLSLEGVLRGAVDATALSTVVDVADLGGSSIGADFGGTTPNRFKVSAWMDIARGILIPSWEAKQHYFYSSGSSGWPAPIAVPKCVTEAIWWIVEPTTAKFTLTADGGDVDFTIPPQQTDPVWIEIGNIREAEIATESQHVTTVLDLDFGLHYKTLQVEPAVPPLPMFEHLTVGCGLVGPWRDRGTELKAVLAMEPIEIRNHHGGSNCPPAVVH